MKFYLAHPFAIKYKVRQWQTSLEKFGLEIINPFFPKRNHECFTKKDKNNNAYYKRLNPQIVVEGDIKLIKKCKGVIAIIDGSLSYGTIQEIVYAKIFKKKIYIICTNGHENHPWLQYHGDKVFTSLKDFKRSLRNKKFRK